MKRIKNKNLYIIVTGILMFLSAIAFLGLNINKPADSAFAAGENSDIIYTIKMSEGGNKISYGNDLVSFSAPDGSGYKTGTVGGTFATSISFEAEPEKYYEIESYTVTWEETKTIKVNDVDNSTGTLTGTGNIVKIFVESDADITDVAVTFDFKKSSYKIGATAKYLVNYQISNENSSNNVDNAEIKLNAPGETTEVTEVKLGDVVNLTIEDDDTTRRFVKYALWNMQESKYEEHDAMITVNNEFLDKYLSSRDEILVIGAFVNVYSVKISDYSESIAENFIEIYLYNNLTKETIECKTKNDIERYFDEGSEPFDEGCYIRILAKTIPYYKFHSFNDGSEILSNEYRINHLNQNYDISAVYTKNKYTIENIDVKDNFGEDIKDSQGGKIAESGGIIIEVFDAETNQLSETNQFSVGDKIIITLPNSVLDYLTAQGFFDNYFSLRIGSTQKYQVLANSSEIEIIADADFLNEYLNLNTGKIKIVSNFVHRYSFELIFDSNNLGDYAVTINGQTQTYTGNFEKQFFNNGTVITIKLNLSKYADYDFGGFYDNLQNNEITVILNGSNRKATLTFVPKVVNIVDKSGNIDGYTITGLDNLTIGKVITIMVSPSGNNEVKSWKFNGSNVFDPDDLPSNAEYVNGVLYVTVTEEWLNSIQLQDLEINNEVGVGLKSGLLTAIIIPSVIAPLLAIVLLAFIVINAKRKKYIKAELTEKGYAEASRNVSGFIEGLREGKDMRQVTDEDVKAEMKKRKGKSAEQKQNKPSEPKDDENLF